ncbi:hypothetical protein ACT7DA_12250 [Bacillus pacificus]
MLLGCTIRRCTGNWTVHVAVVTRTLLRPLSVGRSLTLQPVGELNSDDPLPKSLVLAAL